MHQPPDRGNIDVKAYWSGIGMECPFRILIKILAWLFSLCSCRACAFVKRQVSLNDFLLAGLHRHWIALKEVLFSSGSLFMVDLEMAGNLLWCLGGPSVSDWSLSVLWLSDVNEKHRIGRLGRQGPFPNIRLVLLTLTSNTMIRLRDDNAV